jgi:hypothetical protein
MIVRANRRLALVFIELLERVSRSPDCPEIVQLRETIVGIGKSLRILPSVLSEQGGFFNADHVAKCAR